MSGSAAFPARAHSGSYGRRSRSISTAGRRLFTVVITCDMQVLDGCASGAQEGADHAKHSDPGGAHSGGGGVDRRASDGQQRCRFGRTRIQQLRGQAMQGLGDALPAGRVDVRRSRCLHELHRTGRHPPHLATASSFGPDPQRGTGDGASVSCRQLQSHRRELLVPPSLREGFSASWSSSTTPVLHCRPAPPPLARSPW